MIQTVALELSLPLPPSLNEMLDLAKQRTRRTSSGGCMKTSRPMVYDNHLKAYELHAISVLRLAGFTPPSAPFPRWRLARAAFYLHNLRDPIELMASLKWPVDALVRYRVVENDSPRELVDVCIPTQSIDRKSPRVLLTIQEVD